MAVLDDIGDAGRTAAVVLEHAELAVAIANDIGAVDMDVGAARQVETDHLRAVIGIADHQALGDDAILDDAPLVIDVVEKQVERPNALNDAALDRRPIRGRDDARDDVKREDAVDRILVAVNRECDAEVEQLLLGFGRPPSQRLEVAGLEGVPEAGDLTAGLLVVPQQLAIEIPGVVALECRSRIVGI